MLTGNIDWKFFQKICKKSFRYYCRCTKVRFNEGALSKEAIFREIEGSLKRLQMDYVDLYIIHRWDYDHPIEETMEALN